jgi:predicted GH43/DUF377 family glycosyl hydrolase
MFKPCNEASKINEIREFKTVNMVKRLGVLTANRIHLKNYPLDNPTMVFNSAMTIENDMIKFYARIILGYFTYASSVALIEIALNDIYGGYLSSSHYPAEIVVYPNSKYDMWGIEDPRIERINDKLVMTYCGRTVNYFNPAVRTERTLPVAAVREGPGEKWKKKCAFRFSDELRRFVISDKDAFVTRNSKGDLLLFHRPHLTDEKYYLTVSKIPKDFISEENQKIEEICVSETKVLLESAGFETKLGWATPPVDVGGGECLLLIHGIGKEIECYRVLAVLMKCDEDIELTAITPYYIMEPEMNYEVYGDRPYTIFPCGAQKIDDKLLISYGAADSALGIGEIKIDELLSVLDKYRIK